MNTKLPADRKTKKLLICLTTAQHAELQRKAAAAGLTVSEYIRRAVLD